MQSTDKWYDKYTGLPFLHLGDDPKTGIDCWNLCMYIYRDHRNIDIKQRTIDFCNIVDDNWYNKTTQSLYEDGFKKFSHIFKKVDDAPKVFDVIVMSIGSTLISNHVLYTWTLIGYYMRWLIIQVGFHLMEVIINNIQQEFIDGQV